MDTDNDKRITTLEEQLTKLSNKIVEFDEKNLVLLNAINEISTGIDLMIETTNENFKAVIHRSV